MTRLTKNQYRIGPNHFGTRLRELRRQQEVPAALVARRAGISEDYIYKMENGVTDAPNEDIIRKIASVFKDDVTDELVFSSGRLPEDVTSFIFRYPVFSIRVLRNLSLLNHSGLKYVSSKIEQILGSLHQDNDATAATA